MIKVLTITKSKIKYAAVFVLLGSLLALGLSAKKADALNSTACLRINNANGRITASGTTARASFTIPQKCGRQRISFVSYMAPNGVDGRPYQQQKLFRSVTRTFSPGRHSISVALPNCFYQVDLVRGAPLQSFAGGVTYHSQTRFLAAKHGGTQSCAPKPAVVTPVAAPIVKAVACTKLDADQITASGKLPATVNFTTTIAQQNASVQSYTYDFGDGTSKQTTSSNSTTHAYASAGTFSAAVVIAPSAGATATRTTCSTAVVIDKDTETPVATPAAAKSEPTAKELPDTGPGEIAAIGFGSSFMGALAIAYRRKFETVVDSVISRF